MFSRRVFEIVPHQGVPPVHFGMTQAELGEAMGEPEGRQRSRLGFERWLWFASSFQVGLDRSGRVGEVSVGWDAEGFLARYRDVDLFETPADAVVAMITKHSPGHESEGGYGYTFPELKLELARQALPGDDAEEYRHGRYWTTAYVYTEHFAEEIRAAAEQA